MIVVDTSALLAIALSEPKGPDCARALQFEDTILISAGTLSETLIVAGRRNIGPDVARLTEVLALIVISVSSASALRIGDAYGRWGKGAHPASLNLGDCFAYELATTYDCPLLFIGNDFSQTDVRSVL